MVFGSNRFDGAEENAREDYSEVSNGVSDSNFLDIIIVDRHAYVYLFCKNGNNDPPYSVYSSLMPKDEADRVGIEDFPKLLQLLVKVGDLVTKDTDGSNLYSRIKESNALIEKGERFTIEEVLKAFKFGIYYLIADYSEVVVEGKISCEQPGSDEIRLRKRFYLSPKEAKRAISLMDKIFRESLEGKLIYNRLKYNCLDYVKEIYEGIGLHKSRGEFFGQLGLNLDLAYSKLNKKEDNAAFMMLKAYKIHKDGIIGFQQVSLGILAVIRSFVGI